MRNPRDLAAAILKSVELIAEGEDEFAELSEAARELAQQTQDQAGLCTIAFRPEAYDTAATTLQHFTAHGRNHGFTVHVVPVDGDPFDAELVDLVVDQDAGQWRAEVASWNEQQGCGDRSKMRTFDIYDDLDRLEVL